jgi:hypothetical protein
VLKNEERKIELKREIKRKRKPPGLIFEGRGSDYFQ